MNVFRNISLSMLSLFSQFSYSIILSPTIMSMDTDNELSKQITIKNDSTEKLPLEVQIYQLIFFPDGSYVTRQTDKNKFLIFPPAAILSPGKGQVFRIHWIDKKNLEQSESYFVRFSPVNLKHSHATRSGINLRIHYNALLHVYSNHQKANVMMEITKEGTLKLINNGDRYTYSNMVNFSLPNLESNQALQQKLGNHFIPPHTVLSLGSVSSLYKGEYYAEIN